MSAKLSKDEMTKLALDGVSYGDICRMAFPDKDYKNPASAISNIIGPKGKLKSGPLLAPFKTIDKDDAQVQDIPLEGQETASEEENREYNRTNWAEHYDIIGPLLNKGKSYRFCYEQITGTQNTGVSAGAGLNTHINKKFGDKERFLLWFNKEEEKQSDKIRYKLEQEAKELLAEKLEKEVEKINYKMADMKKENLTLKVVLELCRTKMTKKKVDELEKIAGLFVNNFKKHDDESLNSIKSIVAALESYLTAPMEKPVIA